MKDNHDSRYSEISSFEDFRLERERLIFRRRLIEAKLNLTYLQVSKILSVSSLFISMGKEIVLPWLSDLLGTLIKKIEKDPVYAPDNNKEGKTE
jgi:hypothetical protein